jgi:CheY-like chemotaxis protein
MTGRWSSETILIVDDNSAVLSMTSAMLSRYGYTAIPATSGNQAVELLQNWTDLEIDLILLDVIMEDMTGPETARELRRLRPHVPIVFMTGFPEHREILAVQQEMVIRKPFTSVTLMRKVREVLNKADAAPAGGGGE